MSPSTLKTYLGVYLTNISVLMVSATSGIIVARSLGPAEMGRVALLAYFPSLLATFGTLSIPQAATYYTARGERDVVWAGSAHLVACGAAIATLVATAWYFGIGLSPEAPHSPAALAIVLASGVMAINPLLTGIHQGRRDFRWVNVCLILNAAVYLVGTCTLIFTGHGNALVIVAAQLVTQLVTASVSLSPIGVRWIKTRVPLSDYRRIATRSATYFLPVLAAALLANADRPLLGRYVSVTDLGLYAAAFSLTYPMTLVAETFTQLAFVEVAAVRDRSSVADLIIQRFQLCSVAVVAIALIAIPFIPLAVDVLYGDRFAYTAMVAPWVLVALSMRSLSRFLSNALRGNSITAPSITANAVALVTLLSTAALYVPGRGVKSYAVCLVVAESISLLLTSILGSRALGISGLNLWMIRKDTARALHRTIVEAFSKRDPIETGSLRETSRCDRT